MLKQVYRLLILIYYTLPQNLGHFSLLSAVRRSYRLSDQYALC